jgi:hypothetical protein
MAIATMWRPSKKQTPMNEPKPEDYRDAAEDSLELAHVLAGDGKINDQDFLERMARSDRLVDHDGETCGMCCNMILGAQVAREMLEAGEYEDVVSKWSAEARRRWEDTNFFKLWQKETKAGRDPHQAFEERGWEP